jgi:hypothetical protein
MRYPDGNGEAVGSAAENDGNCAGEENEESRGAIGKSWRSDKLGRRPRGGHTIDICPGRERWIGGQCMSDVVVSAVHIVVFLHLSVAGGLGENGGLGVMEKRMG